MIEVWKKLERFPGYEVSSQGRVKSHKLGKSKLMSIVENNKGYMLCCLFHNNKRYTSYIHRLVAEAFIPTKININFAHINHKDKNPKNNSIENLEWVSPIENLLHRDNSSRYCQYQELAELCDHMTDEQLTAFISLGKTIS
jgi:hypothetical protein